jgi:hypothetical protein
MVIRSGQGWQLLASLGVPSNASVDAGSLTAFLRAIEQHYANGGDVRRRCATADSSQGMDVDEPHADQSPSDEPPADEPPEEMPPAEDPPREG